MQIHAQQPWSNNRKGKQMKMRNVCVGAMAMAMISGIPLGYGQEMEDEPLSWGVGGRVQYGELIRDDSDSSFEPMFFAYAFVAIEDWHVMALAGTGDGWKIRSDEGSRDDLEIAAGSGYGALLYGFGYHYIGMERSSFSEWSWHGPEFYVGLAQPLGDSDFIVNATATLMPYMILDYDLYATGYEDSGTCWGYCLDGGVRYAPASMPLQIGAGYRYLTFSEETLKDNFVFIEESFRGPYVDVRFIW